MGERDDVLQQYRDAVLSVANSTDRPTIFPGLRNPRFCVAWGCQTSLQRGRADALVSCEPATETAERPARNGHLNFSPYSLLLSNNSQNPPGSRKHSHRRWLLLRPKRFPRFPLRGPTIKKPGHSPPGPGPGAGPRRSSGLPMTRRRQRQGKAKFQSLSCIQPLRPMKTHCAHVKPL